MPGLMQGDQRPETYAGPADQAPWWDRQQQAGNAVYLPENVTGDEMRIASGTDWTVSKRPQHYEGGDGLPRLNPNFVSLVRDSDDKWLGEATPTYSLFQNKQGTDLADAVVAETQGEGGHHTMGSLYGGRMVWDLIKLNKDRWVKGDGSPIKDYLLLVWGHDGRTGLTACDSSVRVWCGNTCGAAVKGSSGKVTFRHTSRLDDRGPEIRNALSLHAKHVDMTHAIFNDLARRKMTLDDVVAFTTALLPANPDVERPIKTERDRAEILALFQSSPTLDGVKPTAYRALQAVYEFADHRVKYTDGKKGTGLDRGAEATFDGRGYALKSEAVRILQTA